MKSQAVELVGNNPLTEHQETLANPKAKPGSIQKVRWSKEILEIFKKEFGLDRRDLKTLGAQPIYHHPTKEFDEVEADPDLFFWERGSTNPYDHQWYSVYFGPWDTPVPYKYSIRVPIFGKDNQVIDHHYYQLVPHHDGHGYTIERYRPEERVPRVGFPMWSNKRLDDIECDIYVADCPFLATQIAKYSGSVTKDGPIAIISHGLLKYGYCEGQFRFDDGRYPPDIASTLPENFSDQDAFGLIQHLGISSIGLEDQEFQFFVEGDWLHLPTLNRSLAMLNQALALRHFIESRGGKAIFVMPPEINPDNGPVDLAHLFARHGLSSSEYYYMKDEEFPGFDFVS